MSRPLLTAGFLPLLDSALLVLAHELDFARDEGIELVLVRETSWANIRDRSALGHFDVALMLAPMPIASNLGLTPISVPMIAPIVAGLGNNAITVSADLWRRMSEQGAPGDLQAGPAGLALAEVVRSSPRRLRFGVVHQTSSHNYELRYWLAASGIVPDSDIEIVVLPPPLLPEALGAGNIDGYCVGEPWNSVGVERHGGHIVTTKSHIWPNSPDKVIGMRSDWADRHPDYLAAVIRAVYRAGSWLDAVENRSAAAEILSGPSYLALPPHLVSPAITGDFNIGDRRVKIPDFFVPHGHHANYPWPAHAKWYYRQMVRWNETSPSSAGENLAAATFRRDLFELALGLPKPSSEPTLKFFQPTS